MLSFHGHPDEGAKAIEDHIGYRLWCEYCLKQLRSCKKVHNSFFNAEMLLMLMCAFNIALGRVRF